MDFKNLDLTAAAERGSDLIVRHPVTDEELKSKDGSPITIKVLGNDSRQFRRKMDEIQRFRGRKKGNPSLAESERLAAELLAAVTVEWRGIDWDGKPLECTPENAVMLYKERPWLRSQVDEFVAEAGNFATKAVKS